MDVVVRGIVNVNASVNASVNVGVNVIVYGCDG
jgi:hypothetical protein